MIKPISYNHLTSKNQMINNAYADDIWVGRKYHINYNQMVGLSGGNTGIITFLNDIDFTSQKFYF